MKSFELLKKEKIPNLSIVLLWLIAIFLMGTFIHYYVSSFLLVDGSAMKSSKGTFDLSSFDLNERKLIKLNGKAEFYSDTFLTSDKLKKNENFKPKEYSKVDWIKLSKRDLNKSQRFDVYKLKLLVKNNGWYGIKLHNVKSAYNIFIDGKKLEGGGQLDPNMKLVIPSSNQKEFFFNIVDNQTEIIIQYSNYHQTERGAINTIIFGSMSRIIRYNNLIIGLETLAFGVIFILFIYHLILYSYRRSDKSTLYFSLLCLSMLFRLGYTGEKIFLLVIDYIKWPISTKIEYISLINIPLFSILFLRELFPREIKKWLVNFIIYTCVFLITFVCVLPSNAYSYISIAYHLIIASSIIVALFMTFMAVIHKRDYAQVVFISFFIYFAFFIHDLLYYEYAIDSIYLMPVGLFLVTFSQAYVLAKKTSLTFSKVEDLSNKLRKHANELEVVVDKRTKQIQNQKEEIKSQKNYIEEWAKELKITNEQLVTLAKFKRNMTNMMIHDLKAPLNNIIAFSTLKGDFEKFREYVLSSGWEMKNLIQNILDVEKYEEVGVQLNTTNITLYEIANNAFHNIHFIVTSSKLNFENHISKEIQLVADKNILIRVFANIFTNAVKYCKPQDVIRVTTKKKMLNGKSFYKVNIYNSGMPIPQKQLDEIFNLYAQVDDNQLNHSYSSGIGLAFCKLAINSHGGDIGVKSGKNKGVNFWFTLPAQG